QQDRAQRNTKRLIVLMVLGVLGIIVSVHAVISTAVAWSMPGGQDPATGLAVQRSFTDVFFNPEILGLVALGVVVVVSSGSLYKVKSLAGGGSAVARSLGGRRLEPCSGSANERKLLNVVEEMAIASGIPVPPVYV